MRHDCKCCVRVVDHWKHLWFNGIEEPLFAVENIKVPKSLFVKMKSTMKFYLNGISYLKFRTSVEEFENIIKSSDNNYISLNIVGRFDINRWNGREYPQVIIEDYEIIEDNDPKLIYGIFA